MQIRSALTARDGQQLIDTRWHCLAS